MERKLFINQIRQEIGPVIVNLYSDEQDTHEYLLTYSKNRSLCLGFTERDEKDIEYYKSVAWSCGCECYVLLSDNKVIVYNVLRIEEERYNKDIVFKHLKSFFNYIMQFRYKPEQKVIPYIFKRISQIQEKVADNKEIDYAECYSRLWGGEKCLIPLVDETIDDILNGFIINGCIIKPQPNLIRKYYAHDILCILSMAYTQNDVDINILQSCGNYGSIFLNNFRLPSYVIRNILYKNIHIDNDKPEITIFDPFIWNASFLIETIRELRKRDYQGCIIVKGYTILEDYIKYIEHAIKAVEYKDIEINISYKAPVSSEWINWPSNCDIIIACPIYRMIEDTFTSFRHKENEQKNEDVRKIPFDLMRLAQKSLTKAGNLYITIPTDILNSETYIEDREEVLHNFKFKKIEHLGSYVMKGYGSLTEVTLCKRESEKNNQVKVKWCEDTPTGYDESMRMEVISRSGGNDDNIDLRGYTVPEAQFNITNWAPRPYSEHQVITGILSESRKNLFKQAQNLFRISIGVKTGNNEAFVVNKEIYSNIPDNEKQYFKPVVNRKNLHEGIISDNQYIFYPYNSDRCIFNTETELKKNIPFFGDRLYSYKKYERLTKSKKNYWEYEYWRKLLTPQKSKIVSPTIGNRGAFGIDIEGSYVVLSGYQWVPRRINISEKYLYAYFAILNSSTFWKIVEHYAEKSYTQYVNYKLDIKSIGSVPLPDLNKTEFEQYIQPLYLYGKDISLKGIVECNQEFESLVREIYTGNYE